MSVSFQVLPDIPAVATATADLLLGTVRTALQERGTCRLVLSGGMTPMLCYPQLLRPERRDSVDWSRVEFFFADERPVHRDHADSNFGSVWSGLLSKLPGVQSPEVHRMLGEAADLDAAARAYEAEIGRAFGLTPPSATPPDAPPGTPPAPLPAFDLLWLGMGRDGHTASLFPESSALTEERRWCVATWAPSLGTWRLTLTFPVLNAGRQVLFTVTGTDKADALRRVRAGDQSLAAARVDAARTLWLIDQAAADAADAMSALSGSAEAAISQREIV